MNERTGKNKVFCDTVFIFEGYSNAFEIKCHFYEIMPFNAFEKTCHKLNISKMEILKF